MKQILSILTLGLVALLFAPVGMALGFMAVMLGLSLFMPANAMYSTLPITFMDVLHSEVLRRADDNARPTSFLQSFFRRETVNTLNVSFNTKRYNKRVAVDVNIQTAGNKHKRQIGALETVQPPLYHEWTDLTENNLYTGVLFNSNPLSNDIYEFSRQIAIDLMDMEAEFERARELQVAQVFDNGILKFSAADNINYGRVAGSMVTVTNLWSAGTSDPFVDLSEASRWIRENANTNATDFHAIMGSAAFASFIANEKVVKRQDIRHLKLDDIFAGGIVPSGGAYWGTVTASSGVTIHIWSYDAMYADATNTNIAYIDPKKVVVIPGRNNLTFVDAAVKMLPGTPNFGKYGRSYIYDFQDMNHQVHYYHMKYRGIAIPQEINDIYTMQVLA